MKYLNIQTIGTSNTYVIHNNLKNEILGFIRRERVGKFMHWKLVLTKELFRSCEEIGFTNGCLKEITSFITKLYKLKSEEKK